MSNTIGAVGELTIQDDRENGHYPIQGLARALKVRTGAYRLMYENNYENEINKDNFVNRVSGGSRLVMSIATDFLVPFVVHCPRRNCGGTIKRQNSSRLAW